MTATLFLRRRRQIHVIALQSPCRKELLPARNPLQRMGPVLNVRYNNTLLQVLST